jgi:hypothetical protein
MEENYEKHERHCRVCEELYKLGYIGEDKKYEVQKVLDKYREERNLEKMYHKNGTYTLNDIYGLKQIAEKEKMIMKQKEEAAFIAEVTAQMHVIIPDAVSKLLEITDKCIVKISIDVLRREE